MRPYCTTGSQDFRRRTMTEKHLHHKVSSIGTRVTVRRGQVDSYRIEVPKEKNGLIKTFRL